MKPSKKLFIFFIILISIFTFAFFKRNPFLQIGNLSDETPPVIHSHNGLKQKGVSWVAGRQPITREDFKPLLKNHVNWIVQTPFGWQRQYNLPALAFSKNGGMWGERDIGVKKTTEIAEEFGIHTLLKPHIWLRNRDGKWRSEIEMDNEEDWQTWFDNYRKFILHYAKLAEELDIPAFCIGTELRATVREREKNWRKIISDIRKVYHGKLTYAANWYKEFEEVKFWDDLDFIGIQGYFPLSKKKYPTVEMLKKGWSSHKKKILKIAQKFNKTIVFTEIGYKSTPDSSIEPWTWLNRRTRSNGEVDLQSQADCYEAFFQTFWHEDWFEGVYFWKWFPKHDRVGGEGNRDFTPQNKPAEKVLANWFGKS